MKKASCVVGLMLFCLFFVGQAFAHTPLCSCYSNGDGTVTCEGGFSDGSSAAGVSIAVVNGAGQVLVQGKMDQDSEFTFKTPSAPYKVKFDAGPGHVVEIEGESIGE